MVDMHWDSECSSGGSEKFTEYTQLCRRVLHAVQEWSVGLLEFEDEVPNQWADAVLPMLCPEEWESLHPFLAIHLRAVADRIARQQGPVPMGASMYFLADLLDFNGSPWWSECGSA